MTVVIWLAGCGGPSPDVADRDRTSTDPIVAAYVESIAPILLAKCGDCHHADVALPWYAALPVVGDRVKRDVEWGRQRLDLSLPVPFVGERDAGPRAYLLALRTALLDDSMPPLEYLITHPLAGLGDAETRRVLAWVDAALVAIDREQPAPEAGSYTSAHALVRDRCARCHRDGVAGEMNGDFVDATDLAYLVEDGEYIDPDDLEASLLWERAASAVEPMPPSPNDRLSAAELASLRAWIEAGAELP